MESPFTWSGVVNISKIGSDTNWMTFLQNFRRFLIITSRNKSYIFIIEYSLSYSCRNWLQLDRIGHNQSLQVINASLAALGALAHRRQCQNGCQGAPKCPTGLERSFSIGSGHSHQLLQNKFFDPNTLSKKQGGKEEKIMWEIVATNLVASLPPKHPQTGMATTHVNQSSKSLLAIKNQI